MNLKISAVGLMAAAAMAIPGCASAPETLGMKPESIPSEMAQSLVVGEETFLAAKKVEKAKTETQKKTLPPVELSMSELQPGESLAIILRGISPEGVTVTSNFQDPNFGQYAVRFTSVSENEAIGFLPVSYYAVAGDYSLTVYSTEIPGGMQTFPVKVVPKDFVLQELIVDEGVAGNTIFNDEANKEYRARIWPQKTKYDDARYFDGKFVLPVEGPITTEFGMMRTVNGQPNPRHDGTDISAGTGTPVKAAQNGKVLFSDFVKLTGNTIVIEHGCGLKTWYMHMSKLNVKEGDMVKTGDIIGEVGATGFVTGPHLHFSASICNVYINPFTLIETDYLEKLAAL